MAEAYCKRLAKVGDEVIIYGTGQSYIMIRGKVERVDYQTPPRSTGVYINVTHREEVNGLVELPRNQQYQMRWYWDMNIRTVREVPDESALSHVA